MTIARSHPIVFHKKTVLKVDFRVSDTVNRMDNKVSGKGKRVSTLDLIVSGKGMRVSTLDLIVNGKGMRVSTLYLIVS